MTLPWIGNFHPFLTISTLTAPQVLVSGAPGGVGSVATLLLSQLGYHVVAVTGPTKSQVIDLVSNFQVCSNCTQYNFMPVVSTSNTDYSVQEDTDYLKSLGAAELLDRDSLQGEPKPLARETYAGCVDSAGGKVLILLILILILT